MPRLQKIDIARGIALLAMVIYHFSWNLDHFGFITKGAATSGGLALFARFIATSFLLLVGFSLYLSHRRGIRWANFCKRMVFILGSALLVSVATYLIMPESYIYFGILHEIALASLVALLFLRTPLLFNLVIIILFIALPIFIRAAFPYSVILSEMPLGILQSPYLDWLGLAVAPRFSADFVPFFPWFAAVLSGITLARLMARLGLLTTLEQGIKPQWLSLPLQWLGRHTLAIYLIHQPVLYGAVFVCATLFPASESAMRAEMEQECIKVCQNTNTLATCQTFCACSFDEVERTGLLKPLIQGQLNASSPEIINITNQCSYAITH